MSGKAVGVLLGLFLGLIVLGVLLSRGSSQGDPEAVGRAAVEAFREGRFEAFQPYTPAGLGAEERLRLMCGSGAIQPTCRANHKAAMAGAKAELARFRAAFDESIARAKAAGFDWTDAALVSVDTSDVVKTPSGMNTGVEATGRLLVHGRSVKSGGFVLELTGCAKIDWLGWLCALPRWRPELKAEDKTP